MQSPILEEEGEEQLLTVGELLTASRDHLRKLWRLRVWVVGELSGVRSYPSGHVYFTLKDSKAEVSCIMYARTAGGHPPFPADGTEVRALVQPTIYVQKGRFQLVVEEVAARGRGRLHEEFLRTKERLRERGWFDAGRKRDLPAMPGSVAVVVSLQGAAWRDVKRTLGERFPLAEVSVFPAPAQGRDAAARIADAIGRAGKSGCDLTLVCRGGGSFEDLWSYNEEDVVRAIVESPVPVVTGIGHETDETVADMAADVRAATPTGAAVAAVPSRIELARQLDACARRLSESTGSALDEARQTLDDAVSSVMGVRDGLRGAAWRAGRMSSDLRRASEAFLRIKRGRLAGAGDSFREAVRGLLGAGSRLDGLSARLAAAAARAVPDRQAALDGLSARLEAMSPRRTLERGYAIVTDEEGGVRSRADQVGEGDGAAVHFADGAVRVRVGRRGGPDLGLLGPDDG